MFTGLAHLCFRVRDLDRAVDFYCDKLGLKHGFDFINEQGQRYGAYIHVGQRTFIELFEAPKSGTTDSGDGSGGASGGYQHFCMEVDDLAQTVAQLRNNGVEVTEPKLGLDQSWQAWLSDTEGNRIELHQYTEQSWQEGVLSLS